MILNVIILFLMMLLGVFCFVCSDKFSKGQWLHLIAGYNDLPPKKKEVADIKNISKNASQVALVTGIYIIYLALAIQFIIQEIFSTITHVLLLGIPTFFFVIYVILKTKQAQHYYHP